MTWRKWSPYEEKDGTKLVFLSRRSNFEHTQLFRVHKIPYFECMKQKTIIIHAFVIFVVVMCSFGGSLRSSRSKCVRSCWAEILLRCWRQETPKQALPKKTPIPSIKMRNFEDRKLFESLQTATSKPKMLWAFKTDWAKRSYFLIDYYNFSLKAIIFKSYYNFSVCVLQISC